MIVYRKSRRLRARRVRAPIAPFWASTIIEPYDGPRTTPLAMHYVQMTATGVEKLEIGVADNITDTLSRQQPDNRGPSLVDAAGFCEQVFLRGAEASAALLQRGETILHLITSDGSIPDSAGQSKITVVLAAWPSRMDDLRKISSELKRRDARWGILIPLFFPETTELGWLEEVADLANEGSATFLAANSIELDSSAKQRIGQRLLGPDDEETWARLFHEDLETLHVATERHVAALAGERSLLDFVAPPQWLSKTNWNAAVLLAITGTRLIRMRESPELGWTLLRSAAAVAELGKELSLLVSTANLSIVESIDEISASELTAWLRDEEMPFINELNNRWRLRRDHHLTAV